MNEKLEEYIKYSSDINCVKKIIQFIKNNDTDKILTDHNVKKFLDDAQFSANIMEFINDCDTYRFHKTHLNKLILFYTYVLGIKDVLESTQFKRNEENLTIIKFYTNGIKGILPDIEYYFNYMGNNYKIPNYSVLFEFIIRNIFYIIIIAIIIIIAYSVIYTFINQKHNSCNYLVKKNNHANKSIEYKYPYFEDICTF